MAADWLTIRNDYINGGGSYRQLSEKYGVSLRSIAKHAKDEDWQQRKTDNLNSVAKAVQQKTTEKKEETTSKKEETTAKKEETTAKKEETTKPDDKAKIPDDWTNLLEKNYKDVKKKFKNVKFEVKDTQGKRCELYKMLSPTTLPSSLVDIGKSGMILPA